MQGMVVKMVDLGYVLDGNHNRPSLYRERAAGRSDQPSCVLRRMPRDKGSE
jgi:hypothetical protein